MATVQEIARRAADVICEEMGGDVWGREDEVLQIITEAIEAGVREGQATGFAAGFAASALGETSDAMVKILNNMFTRSPARRDP